MAVAGDLCVTLYCAPTQHNNWCKTCRICTFLMCSKLCDWLIYIYLVHNSNHCQQWLLYSSAWEQTGYYWIAATKSARLLEIDIPACMFIPLAKGTFLLGNVLSIYPSQPCRQCCPVCTVLHANFISLYHFWLGFILHWFLQVAWVVGHTRYSLYIQIIVTISLPIIMKSYGLRKAVRSNLT